MILMTKAQGHKQNSGKHNDEKQQVPEYDCESNLINIKSLFLELMCS